MSRKGPPAKHEVLQSRGPGPSHRLNRMHGKRTSVDIKDEYCLGIHSAEHCS